MMAAGGPAGNMRVTRSGTVSDRPVASKTTAAAKPWRGAISAAEKLVIKVRRFICMGLLLNLRLS
jgi:hypothetical protein